jgi:hypothetical protein
LTLSDEEEEEEEEEKDQTGDGVIVTEIKQEPAEVVEEEEEEAEPFSSQCKLNCYWFFLFYLIFLKKIFIIFFIPFQKRTSRWRKIIKFTANARPFSIRISTIKSTMT